MRHADKFLFTFIKSFLHSTFKISSTDFFLAYHKAFTGTRKQHVCSNKEQDPFPRLNDYETAKLDRQSSFTL